MTYLPPLVSTYQLENMESAMRQQFMYINIAGINGSDQNTLNFMNVYAQTCQALAQARLVNMILDQQAAAQKLKDGP